MTAKSRRFSGDRRIWRVSRTCAASGSSALHHRVSREYFLGILPLVIRAQDAVSRLIKPAPPKCRNWAFTSLRPWAGDFRSSRSADIHEVSRHVSKVPRAEVQQCPNDSSRGTVAAVGRRDFTPAGRFRKQALPSASQSVT